MDVGKQQQDEGMMESYENVVASAFELDVVTANVLYDCENRRFKELSGLWSHGL